jgi:hypothetical protein
MFPRGGSGSQLSPDALEGTRGEQEGIEAVLEDLAHFERSIEYRSRIAQKAVATRKKNEADAKSSSQEGSAG